MAFLDNNLAAGVSPNDTFKIGSSDVDPGTIIEDGVLLPWPSDPLVSWVYYDCSVGVFMDSGIVVHTHLPQVDNIPDSLASCLLDDAQLDKIAGPGVNLRSLDQYADIVQRMGHSRYWFRIWGEALRVGQKVPIPGIKTIGGVPAIPFDRTPQWAFNRVAPGGNYSGVILWHAAWSLWYTTAVPPRTNDIPAANTMAHIRVDSRGPSPDGIQSPYTQQDDNALPHGPGGSKLGPPK